MVLLAALSIAGASAAPAQSTTCPSSYEYDEATKRCVFTGRGSKMLLPGAHPGTVS
jgi:hypothetical protein